MSERNFVWPEGKRCALTLTFDDARESQIDEGIPVMNRYNVKGSFYVSFAAFVKRIDEWKGALAAGHEIGNHTVNHPCSCNFSFSRERGLEAYTLERMEQELVGANEKLHELIGTVPKTFAYPCGQKFVGRGDQVKSYVPLVAKYFLCGRGFRDEAANAPECCDLAQAYGMQFDNFSFEEAKTWIDRAQETGGWLMLVGHNTLKQGRQTVLLDALESLCEYASDPANGIWIDTAAEVAGYIKEWQNTHVEN